MDCLISIKNIYKPYVHLSTSTMLQ